VCGGTCCYFSRISNLPENLNVLSGLKDTQYK
jgi:hypothetical protein